MTVRWREKREERRMYLWWSLCNNKNNSYIIIMDICEAPTLRLKALNKNTRIMYIEMENVIKKIKMYISTSVQA